MFDDLICDIRGLVAIFMLTVGAKKQMVTIPDVHCLNLGGLVAIFMLTVEAKKQPVTVPDVHCLLGPPWAELKNHEISDLPPGYPNS